MAEIVVVEIVVVEIVRRVASDERRGRCAVRSVAGAESSAGSAVESMVVTHGATGIATGTVAGRERSRVGRGCGARCDHQAGGHAARGQHPMSHPRSHRHMMAAHTPAISGTPPNGHVRTRSFQTGGDDLGVGFRAVSAPSLTRCVEGSSCSVVRTGSNRSPNSSTRSSTSAASNRNSSPLEAHVVAPRPTSPASTPSDRAERAASTGAIVVLWCAF